jgi:hypothetical protein
METADNWPKSGRIDTIATTVLKYTFVATAAAIVVYVAFRGQWKCELRIANTSYLIDLPRAPVWQPPKALEYEAFLTTFRSLPPRQPTGSTIERSYKWNWMGTELILWLWLASAVVGILYSIARGHHFDPILHYVSNVAIGPLS